jgi:hypothetical protein
MDIDETTRIDLNVDLHWQEMDHVKHGADASGQSVEAFLDQLIHDAILAEMLEQGRQGKAEPWTPERSAELKQRLKNHLDSVRAAKAV